MSNKRSFEVMNATDGENTSSISITAYDADIVVNAELVERMTLRQGPGVSRYGLIRVENPLEEIWVDRYDVRLLLDSTTWNEYTSTSSEPTADADGWDASSDAEETFHMSKSEMEDYQRNKRRRALERLREERMNGIQLESESKKIEKSIVKWPFDEMPESAQVEVMKRTASHFAKAANRSQLSSRILINNATDPRFDFLRGRWKQEWERILKEAEKPRKEPQKKGSLKKEFVKQTIPTGSLVDYAEEE